ncbi:MAG: hypothetical protein ACQES5_11425 [Thermodesulfobacteriota bacterium]
MESIKKSEAESTPLVNVLFEIRDELRTIRQFLIPQTLKTDKGPIAEELPSDKETIER